MKKIIYILIIFFFTTSVSGAEKSTLYFFMSTSCSHCTDALETLNDLEGKYDEYFDIIIFDVNLDDNYLIYEQIIEKYEFEYYVPLFVVGDEYAVIGYSDEALSKAIEITGSETYTDYVESLLENTDGVFTTYSLKEACEAKGINYYEEDEIAIETQETSQSYYPQNVIIASTILAISTLLIVIIIKKNKK